MQITFNLDYYFKKTNVYYALFDGLFTLSNIEKESILNELGIIPSSYRSQRANYNVKNKNNIKILLDYFKYKQINSEEQCRYEILITKIYYYCYYKQLGKLEILLNEIIEEATDQTTLKPMLTLFKVFIYSNLEYSIIKAKENISDDLEYLAAFYNKKYFIDDFEFIYLLMMYHFDVFDFSVDVLIDNLSLQYPKLLWLYSFIKASKAYINKNDIVALVNYEIALTEFRNSNNFTRYIITASNVSYLYNISEEYSSCLKLCSSILENILCDDEGSKRSQMLLMNYLFANLMLERYNEIIDFISILVFDYNSLNYISAIICLIVCKKVDNEELSLKIRQLYNDHESFQIFIRYVETKDSEVLDSLINTPYLNKIKKIAKTCF